MRENRNYMIDKTLIYNMYKQLICQYKKLTINGQKTWIYIFFFWIGCADGQQTHEKMLNITNHEKWKSKLQWDITSHLLEWPSSKRSQITNIGEDAERREPLYFVGEKVNWCNHYEKPYGESSEKLKIELSYDLAIPLGI